MILPDLLMPDVSGFEVALALNNGPETTSIPIIVVTSKQVTAADRKALNGFVTAILEKADLDQVRLVNEVRRAMSGRRAGS